MHRVFILNSFKIHICHKIIVLKGFKIIQAPFLGICNKLDGSSDGTKRTEAAKGGSREAKKEKGS